MSIPLFTILLMITTFILSFNVGMLILTLDLHMQRLYLDELGSDYLVYGLLWYRYGIKILNFTRGLLFTVAIR